MELPTHKNKTPLHQTLLFKSVALFFGFYLWFIIGSHHKITFSKKIPVVFYNKQASIIDGPDAIIVTLHGSRKEFSHIFHTLALHIDAQKIPLGTTTLKPDREQLFVSQSIDVIHYTPKTVTVTRSS